MNYYSFIITFQVGYNVQNNFGKAEEYLLISLKKIQTYTRHSDTFDYELSDIYYYLSMLWKTIQNTQDQRVRSKKL
jgi:hypothetical protein